MLVEDTGACAAGADIDTEELVCHDRSIIQRRF
jgi:hypothetical protein